MSGLPALFAPAALKAVVGDWWRLALALIVAAGLCLPLGYCKGERAERARWEAKAAKLDAQAQRVARAADALAAQRQAEGEAAISAQRKEIDDAARNIPDQAPTARQHARACIELLRQARARGLPDPAC